MLVLTRKAEETIQIGDDIVVKVIKTSRGTVKIGIDAPEHIRVMRGELLEKVAAALTPALPEPSVSKLADHFKGAQVLSDQYPHVA